ncbi:Uncharacterised protein g11373 [Pycnogonum litorale]
MILNSVSFVSKLYSIIVNSGANGPVSGECGADMMKCTNLIKDIAKAGKDKPKACKALKSFIDCFEDKASNCKKVFDVIEPQMKEMRKKFSETCGSSAILSSVVVVFIGYFFNSLF